MPPAPERRGRSTCATRPPSRWSSRRTTSRRASRTGSTDSGPPRARARSTSRTTELLLVDDGSTDDTLATARGLAAEFPIARVVALPRNQGKGAAVRAGILSATRRQGRRSPTPTWRSTRRCFPSLLDALDRVPVAVGLARRARPRRLRHAAAHRRGSRVQPRGPGDRRRPPRRHPVRVQGLPPRRRPAPRASSRRRRATPSTSSCSGSPDRLDLDVEVVPVTWLDVPGSVGPRRRGTRADARSTSLAARRRARWVAVGDARRRRAGAAPGAPSSCAAGRATMLCGVGRARSASCAGDGRRGHPAAVRASTSSWARAVRARAGG